MTTQANRPTIPVAMPHDPHIDLALAKTFGLSDAEWNRACEGIGRTPTYAELGVFSVMWSEHCSYKSSRVHLRRLPTQGPRVVQGPGENAGAVDIGDGFCAVFKMESHNHPSFIEPYQGAATGVGGILRDVFTMGARPIASLNSLRFGRADHPLTKRLVRGVVAGIGGYGNCIGVPTVGGELQFDSSYDGNILVNAFTVGIARTDELFFGRAEGVGNSVLYVGAKTGRDGIHGATMASQEFDEHSAKKLPTVQVGDPFTEKLLLEACLEIFAADCLEGVQDMGAAGLTSSSVEMAARAGTGLELDLDAIPRRTRGLSPYEMLLSESQERMLMVAKPGREHVVLETCKKWDLDVAVVGRVTDTGRFVCKATPDYDPFVDPSRPRAPQVVVDIPIASLTDDAPVYDRPQQAANEGSVTVPERVQSQLKPRRESEARMAETLSRAILDLVGSPNIGSRRRVYSQYDHIVRGGTVLRPGEGDAAIVRAFTSASADWKADKYLAIAVDGNGRHVQLDPYQGAAMIVAECARNIVCVGAEPLGLTDCLNFGSPEKPETMWRFARAIDGLRDACVALGVPVVSGNVSLYNETDGVPILPTPSVAIVGQLLAVDHRLSMAFKAAGHVVALVGEPRVGNLGGSEWLTQQAGSVCGDPVGIDLDAEAKLQKAMLALASRHLLHSAHDLSDGGLAVALAECAITGGVGCTVTVPLNPSYSPEASLFSEEPSRIVVTYAPGAESEVHRQCAEHGVPIRVLGTVGGHAVDIEGLCSVNVDALTKRHEAALDFLFED